MKSQEGWFLKGVVVNSIWIVNSTPDEVNRTRLVKTALLTKGVLMSSSWILLILAGLAEIAFAVGLKYTEGFSKPIPTILTIIAMLISLFLLSRASLQLPIGTAYSVWVGIGAIGASILGVFLFQESLTFLRAFFLILLLVSIIGLKVTQA